MSATSIKIIEEVTLVRKTEVESVERLSEAAMKTGTYNYLLGLMGAVMLILLSGLGYIIAQNSAAITSIPRDIAILTSKLDSMDKKLDLLIFERFELKRREIPSVIEEIK